MTFLVTRTGISYAAQWSEKKTLFGVYLWLCPAAHLFPSFVYINNMTIVSHKSYATEQTDGDNKEKWLQATMTRLLHLIPSCYTVVSSLVARLYMLKQLLGNKLLFIMFNSSVITFPSATIGSKYDHPCFSHCPFTVHSSDMQYLYMKYGTLLPIVPFNILID